MENILDLYRTDFVHEMWKQVCQQLDVPVSAQSITVVFNSVDFS